MNNFIKLNMFVPKEEIGQENDMIIESWIDANKFIVLQDASRIETRYKTFALMSGVDEGLRFMETVDYILMETNRDSTVL